jgi:adenylosuccinate lyase
MNDPTMIPNVLAQRYASPEMQEIWSATGRIILERELWIAVMKAQRELGLEISQEAIEAYQRVKSQVDLESIHNREKITRHDVKARIEEFCELAGHQEIHRGMTSRDLTENVEQLQVYRSLELVRNKIVASLIAVADRAEHYRELVMTARTHNVAAQPTTFGKRLAMFGEELLFGLGGVEQLLKDYPVRGLKGAVGTQLDQLSLFEHKLHAVEELEEKIVGHLGIGCRWENVGQVYPRSLDLRFLNLLVEIASGPSSFAKTIRLMAGHETASEGFAKGQTGSSAMPHKMNSRSCERINGFHVILKGYQAMAAGLAGDQWNEGDVSCSVVRRVMLPDACFAIDGLLETFLTVLKQLEVYPAVIERELRHYLPFLMTTTVMMAAVRQGVGRETAHQVIKEHALAAAHSLRSGGTAENQLWQQLAADQRLKLSAETLRGILVAGKQQLGTALLQTDRFVAKVRELGQRYPQAARYQPREIL